MRLGFLAGVDWWFVLRSWCLKPGLLCNDKLVFYCLGERIAYLVWVSFWDPWCLHVKGMERCN